MTVRKIQILIIVLLYLICLVAFFHRHQATFYLHMPSLFSRPVTRNVLRRQVQMDEEINFYSVNDEYGEFSNFAAYPIKLNGKVWPTTEHYFQAMKFESKKDQNEIRLTKSPMEAARKGRDRKRKLRRNWESIKDNVMREAVMQKFTHPEIKELLLRTGSAKLVEHTENDSYWGDGGNGSGKNKLGRILMEVREKLRA